jgi:WD40 repeat protein
VSTVEDFLAGELKGVSVTGDGTVSVAPALSKLLDTQQAFVYSAAVDRTGALYVGTGNEGKIFRVGADGNGAQWAKLAEPGVHALAFDSNNRVLAATSPDGKVYRFNETGEAQAFFDPEEKYIWCLASDKQGNLFVGTGPHGMIFKVTPDGKSEVFYDSRETHIVTLEWTPDGELLAGGAPGAQLFKISPAGAAFVLYDSPLQELRAIALDRYGNIYAAALSGSQLPEDQSTSSAGKSSTTSSDSATSGDTTLETAPTDKGKKIEVYRIDKTNLVELLYSSNDGPVFDLAARPDSSLLAATGYKGRIVSIDPRRFVSLVVQTPEEQVTQLVEQGGRLYAATSNLGKVFQIGGKAASVATYESKVFDAGVVAAWGTIRWRMRSGEPGRVKLFTRSGNTETADQTWSEWSGPYTNSQGSPVNSPGARFLQWKLEFPTATGGDAQAEAVEFVSVSYLQRNMAPVFKAVTVHAPGLAFLESAGISPSGGASPGGPNDEHLRSLPRLVRDLEKSAPAVPPRKVFSPGARSLSWTASDPNGDDLVYSVFIREQGDTAWRMIKTGLDQTQCTLDGLSLPNGLYYARVIASDRPSNPPASALDAQIVTKAFVIANSTPTVQFSVPQVQGRRATFTATAAAQASFIHQCEYSVDGADWVLLFPKDGIADSDSEEYTWSVDNLTAGEHLIWLRAVDSVGNLGAGKLAVSIP